MPISSCEAVDCRWTPSLISLMLKCTRRHWEVFQCLLVPALTPKIYPVPVTADLHVQTRILRGGVRSKNSIDRIAMTHGETVSITRKVHPEKKRRCWLLRTNLVSGHAWSQLFPLVPNWSDSYQQFGFVDVPLCPNSGKKYSLGWRFLGNEMTPISRSAKHVNLFVDRCETQTIENIKCVSGKDLNRHGTLNTYNWCVFSTRIRSRVCGSKWNTDHCQCELCLGQG